MERVERSRLASSVSATRSSAPSRRSRSSEVLMSWLRRLKRFYALAIETMTLGMQPKPHLPR